ncbi:hypothetical protein ACFVUS_43425 [Nocardia sp. NPDC058058]|uniref:hypothetical protein n=1 Tax=Nocardia sp. NPDC058058 TaxID=3346317 RepID=UPI0036DD34A1
MTASILGGCSLAGTHDDSKPACTAGFDIGRAAETLGSADRFFTEYQNAEKRAEPVRLGDITRAAGWSDDWVRMVEVPPNITERDLNRDAGTSENCWRGLPRGDGSDHTVYGYYLFVKNEGGPMKTVPVQSVRWPKAVRVVGFENRRALAIDTLLLPDHGGLVPAP